MTSAITSPAPGSNGTSACSPPKMTNGNPAPAPSALDRIPHQSPLTSTTTTGNPAWWSCSTNRWAVADLPAPRLARIANVEVTDSTGSTSPGPHDPSTGGHQAPAGSGRTQTSVRTASPWRQLIYSRSCPCPRVIIRRSLIVPVRQREPWRRARLTRSARDTTPSSDPRAGGSLSRSMPVYKSLRYTVR